MTKVRFECIECKHLFRMITQDELPERNTKEEVCSNCGTKSVPWLVWIKEKNL